MQENTVGKRRRTKSVCVGEGAHEEGFKEETCPLQVNISTGSVQATSVLSAGCFWRLSSNSFLQSTFSLCLSSNQKDLQFPYLLPCHLQQAPEAQQSNDHHWCKVFNLLMFVHFLCVWDVGLHQLESPSSAVKIVTMQLVLFSKISRGSMGFQAVSYCWYLLLLFSWAKSISKSSSVFTSAAVKPNTKPVLPQKTLPTAVQHKYLSEWITGRLKHLHHMCSNRKRKRPMECTNYVTMQRRANFCIPRFQHVLNIIGMYYWHWH